MRLVIIESPFAGDRLRNDRYLDQCLRDSIKRGESPLASHAIYPRVLHDKMPEERDLGMRCGYAWWKHAAAIIFYVDYGMSPGMHRALQRAKTMQMATEMRKILDANN